jgi:hypothetical protein
VLEEQLVLQVQMILVLLVVQLLGQPLQLLLNLLL